MTLHPHLLWMVRVSLLLAGSVLGRAERVSADPAPANAGVTEAERYADQAFQAYEAKRYVEAVTLYRKSYAAAPSAAILYNIARIYDVGLRDRPLAISFYRQYVSDPGSEVKYIGTANERLLALRAADEAAASYPSERVPSVGSAPPSAAALPEAPAAQRQSQATAVRAPPDVSLQERLPASKSDASPLRTAAAVAMVAGIASIGLGCGFGIAAMSKASTAKDQCDGNRCSSQAGVDAAESAKDRATVSTIGFAVGGVFAATAAVLWWFGRGPSLQTEQRANVHLAPLASHQVIGALMHGGF